MTQYDRILPVTIGNHWIPLQTIANQWIPKDNMVWMDGVALMHKLIQENGKDNSDYVHTAAIVV